MRILHILVWYILNLVFLLGFAYGMVLYLIVLYDFLFQSGKFLSVLPVDPKLGKMLIMGAMFRCFDPVLTIVAGLSMRDPFLLPQDKKDVSRAE